MTKELILQAELKEKQGKSTSRRLRREGIIPAVLYGEGKDALPLSVHGDELEKIMKSAGENAIIKLSVPGKAAETAMICQRQYNPMEGSLLHIDFLRINLEQKVTARVAIQTVNEAEGIKEGGVLEHHLWEATIECLPQQIPGAIEVDISSLQIGDSLHVRDITSPEGVEITNDEKEMVVSIVPPTVVEEEAPATPEEGEAEPEVITEKDKGKEKEKEEKEEKGKKEEKGEKGEKKKE